MDQHRDDWVRLTCATRAFQADLLIGRLHEEGIEATAMKGPDAPGAWLTGTTNTLGPIDIYVPSAHLAHARRLLAEFDPSGARISEPKDGSGITMKVVGAVVAVAVIAAVVVTAISEALG